MEIDKQRDTRVWNSDLGRYGTSADRYPIGNDAHYLPLLLGYARNTMDYQAAGEKMDRLKVPLYFIYDVEIFACWPDNAQSAVIIQLAVAGE